MDRVDVAIIGAGAAGLAAARRLSRTSLSHIVLEARDRIGGRAHTVEPTAGLPIDLGCGWLHSADHNPLALAFEEAGLAVDKTPPHWERQAEDRNFPAEQQRAFGEAFAAFDERLAREAAHGIDRPAAELFDPACPWNPLIDAVSSYYNGVEFSQVSLLDYSNYLDTDVNWRVRDGYGAALARLAHPGAALRLGCVVEAVDHSGNTVLLHTSMGPIETRAVIITLPTPLIAQGRLKFAPDLPDKREAAAALPLGLADKVFLHVSKPDLFPADGHLFGHPDRTATGSYHLRPFGRPYIEAFLGGRCARSLEDEGASAAFVLDELTALYGSDIRKVLTPVTATRWARDPWALGAYSHALPGHSHARALLAAPVDRRLLFAGEATSSDAYSTAHGAWLTGLRAAAEILAALG